MHLDASNLRKFTGEPVRRKVAKIKINSIQQGGKNKARTSDWKISDFLFSIEFFIFAVCGQRSGDAEIVCLNFFIFLPPQKGKNSWVSGLLFTGTLCVTHTLHRYVATVAGRVGTTTLARTTAKILFKEDNPMKMLSNRFFVARVITLIISLVVILAFASCGGSGGGRGSQNQVNPTPTNNNPKVVGVVVTPDGPYVPGQEVEIRIQMINGPGVWPLSEIDLGGFTVIDHSWDGNNKWIARVKLPDKAGTYNIWTLSIIVSGNNNQVNAGNAGTVTGISVVSGDINNVAPGEQVTLRVDVSGWSIGQNESVPPKPTMSGEGGFAFSWSSSGYWTVVWTAPIIPSGYFIHFGEKSITITVILPVEETLRCFSPQGELRFQQYLFLKEGEGVSLNFKIGDQTVMPTMSGDLPDWSWSKGTLSTVKWANPSAPDPKDGGNSFVPPGMYRIKFTSGRSTTRIVVEVTDRSDFP